MTQFRSFSLLLLLLLLLDEITKGRGFIPLAKPKNQVIQRISHQRLLHGASKEGTDVINRKTNSKNNNDGESDTGASIPNLTISLIKSIVGGGGKFPRCCSVVVHTANEEDCVTLLVSHHSPSVLSNLTP